MAWFVINVCVHVLPRPVHLCEFLMEFTFCMGVSAGAFAADIAWMEEGNYPSRPGFLVPSIHGEPSRVVRLALLLSCCLEQLDAGCTEAFSPGVASLELAPDLDFDGVLPSRFLSLTQ